MTGVAGVDVDLLGVISERVGFTFRLKREPYWSRYDPGNRTWSGTLGSVGRGLSTVGIGHILLNREDLKTGDNK